MVFLCFVVILRGLSYASEDLQYLAPSDPTTSPDYDASSEVSCGDRRNMKPTDSEVSLILLRSRNRFQRISEAIATRIAE